MLNCRVVKHVKMVKFSGTLNMLNCRVVKHVEMVKFSGALNMLNCRVVGQHLVKPSRLYGRPNIWNILLRGIIPKIMKFWCQLEELHLEASWYLQGVAYQDDHQGARNIPHVHLPHCLPWVEGSRADNFSIFLPVCFGPTSSNRFLYKDLVKKHFEDVEKVEQVKIPI